MNGVGKIYLKPYSTDERRWRRMRKKVPASGKATNEPATHVEGSGTDDCTEGVDGVPPEQFGVVFWQSVGMVTPQ